MIEVKLLQTPEIFYNNEQIVFPYKKAEALFYYIAIEKSVTRDTAVGMLWEDNDESTAKKNLRHALYIIKKAFGIDIIQVEKYKLELNTAYEVQIDMDIFLNENRLELFGKGLLKGFSVKNAYSYEEWLLQKQNYVKDIYLTRLFNYIKDLPYTSLEKIEEYCSLYIQADPLDERIYEYLMKTYYNNELFHKGIKTYQKLSKILGDELGITPNKTITALYYTLLNEWSENSADESDFLPQKTPKLKARESELSKLSSLYNKFRKGCGTNVMIVGENGAGKTHLVKTFLSNIDNSSLLILQTSCFQAEKNFLLQPMNNIMFQLEDYIEANDIQLSKHLISSVAKLFPGFFDSGSLSPSENYVYSGGVNSVARLFQIVSRSTPILLIIDNINAMDNSSLEVLKAVMRLHNPNIMVLSTCLDIVDYDLVTFISTMVKDGLLEQLPLSKLTIEDVHNIVYSHLGKNKLDEETIKNLYKETDGNIFFLMETINNLRNNMNPNELSFTAQGILNDRLNGISKDSRHLLDLISAFVDQATLEILAEIQCKTQLEILELIEELKEHSLITEVNVGNTGHFCYRHSKMRDFVYNKLSPSKLRILHNKIGEALENHKLQPESVWHKRLIYHFTIGENTAKVLYYSILNLEQYSNIMFELYPVLGDFDEALSDKNRIEAYFEKLTCDLEDYNNNDPSFFHYNELRARLLLSECRYYIQTGKYELGLAYISEALENPFVKKNPSLHLGFIRQQVYYSIQVCDVELMDQCTYSGLMLSRAENNNVEHAVYHRLRGLYFILRSDYKKAIVSLLKSIDYLEQASTVSHTYIINIAAAYNYLGELHRKQCHFKEAESYYKKSIELLENNNIPPNPTFYANLGRTYYDEHNFEKSHQCFKKAYEQYSVTSIIVGRATTLAYMSMYSCFENNFELGEKYMQNAVKVADTLRSPLEKGIVCYIQSHIQGQFPNKLKCLTMTSEYYMEKCEKIFKPFNENYFLQDLQL